MKEEFIKRLYNIYKESMISSGKSPVTYNKYQESLHIVK